MTLSRKEINAQLMEAHAHLFRCPNCAAGMEMFNSSALFCLNNHSFDLSKNGYVNLAPQAHVTKYDKSLFEARKTVMASGFFKPVLDFMTHRLAVRLGKGEQSVVLDAGCGEGTHLSSILSQLTGVTGVGIDLAKEGVAAASKMYPGTIWTVADLANCPFADEQFDAILNILSPANYAEFTRLLKPGKLIQKAVPESGYLKELRDIFYEGKEQKEDSNPVGRFAEHFDEVQTERITYCFELPKGLLAPLIRMTPLTWGTSPEKIEEVLRMDIPEITVDFTIISGVKRVE
ncbi:methyltransferase domain-containing protein [Filibacter tadaridae]|uniref:23S rRNA (Guanine(745)-N(1))-methyltransferase n=1 Tax=Filibacter tadaridae TaxID=2483811 RepID=A0A3P5WZF4_9BACL|nr:methyltransferase domain-containing protein [Filibacter tadaridae]VDC20959.1 23S rRNA (guanine(745)-N(1))-methyltransferase [Filibacter tadaridae]